MTRTLRRDVQAVFRLKEGAVDCEFVPVVPSKRNLGTLGDYVRTVYYATRSLADCHGVVSSHTWSITGARRMD